MKSIKHLLPCLCLLLLCSLSTRAQNYNEIFRQKKTQKKYLLQQIAALQVYTGYLEKGYQLASSGLGTIRKITKGEFSLHEAFITGLKKVSPYIKANAPVTEIIALQLQVLADLKRLKDASPETHRDYIRTVSQNTQTLCLQTLEALLLVTTSGKLEMSDDQRLERLGELCTSMRDCAEFTRSFSNKAALLFSQQRAEQRDLQAERSWYE